MTTEDIAKIAIIIEMKDGSTYQVSSHGYHKLLAVEMIAHLDGELKLTKEENIKFEKP